MAKKFYKENGEAIPAIIFELIAPTGFTEITDAEEIKYLYITQYENRKQDGKNFVTEFTADLYINVLNSVYTSTEVFSLETHISKLYENLNNGWWLTAQNTNLNLPLNGVYTQDMKDSIQNIINTYITNNY